jgi:hypothetical protein
MGHEATQPRVTKTAFALLATFLLALSLAPNALATPFHTRNHSLDIAGLNHACGVAVDSKGDLYASSAGTSEVKVYDPSHNFLTSIPDSHEPCGLAVTTTGVLYVSEQAEGKVVRFKPTAYPFSGTPTYEPREVIDSSGNAKGIAVDPFDNRLYVAEGTKVAIYKADGSFEANVGEGTLSEATGVAAFTYTVFPSGIEKTERYLWVADARGLAADSLYLFGGTEPSALKLRRTLEGANTPNGSFGFGTAGAYLAADPGNRTLRFANKGEILGGECKVVGEQACTAGHLFLYDAGHEALDEFDASGEYLDQTKNAGFADAEPIAIAIDRSGEANDGTIYVTAGSGAGAKALAFKPLTSPSRKVLKEPSEEVGGLSHTQVKAESIATDSYGDVYSGSATLIHVYNSSGTELKTATSQPLIKDTEKPKDIAVDSSCNVYVLDAGANEFASEEKVTYYAPSACPPVAGTTYTRHASVALPTQWPEPESIMKAIAVNPGPGPSKDRLFVTTGPITHVYKSAAEGSGLLDEEFAPAGLTGNRQSIAVNGARGIVYIGVNPHLIYAVDEATEEVLGRIENSGDANGKIGSNPYVAVDQASGHVITFDGATKGAREYDAAGAFVAEFGNFTEGLSKEYRVAVDNSCVLHELTEATVPTCHAYDPANGTVYVAFDDSNLSHPPYDVNAFGPLDYGTAPVEPKEFKLTAKVQGAGSGTVTATGISCPGDCSEVYEEGTKVPLSESASEGSEFKGWSGACSGTGACEVTMTEAKEVTATFNLEAASKFPLTLKKSGTGQGTVTSSPVGIACGPACAEESAEFPAEAVTLTASPATGSEFVGWGIGDCESEPELGKKCVVMTSSAKTVHATFSPIPRTLTIAEAGTGTGQVKCKFNGGSAGACTSPQPNGTAVEIIATADVGSTFAGFSAGTGSASGCSTSPCAFTIEADSALTASFEAEPTPEFTLTVEVFGEGEVTDGLGLHCTEAGNGTSACEARYPEGSTIALTASAGPGFEFAGWGGACTGAGACEVTMSAAKALTATFQAEAPPTEEFPLSLTKEGTGSGAVTSSPTGIDCGGICAAEFEKEAQVTLTASPDPGSAFIAWKHCDSVEGRICKVKMSAAKAVAAKFTKTYEVTIEKAEGATGLGSVSGVACAATCTSATMAILEGKTVTLKPKASKGSEFSGWNGCPEIVEVLNCTVSAEATVKADFSEVAKFKLTVDKSGGGQGTLKSLPAGINCALTCSTMTSLFYAGTSVELSASVTAGKGSAFTGFTAGSGSASGCGAITPCTFALGADSSLTAKFE